MTMASSGPRLIPLKFAIRRVFCIFVQINRIIHQSEPPLVVSATHVLSPPKVQEPSDFATLARVFGRPNDTGPQPAQGRRLKMALMSNFG